MWVSNAGQDGFSTQNTDCELYISEDGVKWKRKAKLNFDKDFLVWHLEVREKNNKYFMLFSGRRKMGENGLSLYCAKSKDGINWEINEETLIQNSEIFPLIYKPSFIFHEGKIKIWYSTMSNTKEWKNWYTERPLDVFN
ncbi:hypothetical protein CO154_00895 [Candidatus Pacearchaeota archaeon CG_4_9_14_3_um_filter_31_7]|nr:MAG: hypothetical protein AUJ10_02790 [Candidatus Pacearchaeota archaeon CG1_02_31_27]PIN92100.1 MAG: hypothetical protein COU55_02850 [Candidatus Pacearchaeota archaeon CG10_big_fil_rev_8_21_14_0_10_31_59]PIZ80315.1 MAG: hypothetical protein COX99_02955 [Candidatus Pacearchaeota archaeon CG_4_10_14_0_2_um_filter_31_10]PJA70831.1 MAG: hypothetical protein CO154_00895 [Candidatus Pacearchaeota archaeon CG_4_9_14_3_um_filter_31_7]